MDKFYETSPTTLQDVKAKDVIHSDS